MKVTKVIPINKADHNIDVNNYRPIYVLPYFLKMLQRIIYSCFQKYVKDHVIMYAN